MHLVVFWDYANFPVNYCREIAITSDPKARIARFKTTRPCTCSFIGAMLVCVGPTTSGTEGVPEIKAGAKTDIGSARVVGRETVSDSALEVKVKDAIVAVLISVFELMRVRECDVVILVFCVECAEEGPCGNT